MTETVVGQLAHSCMRQRRPPPTSCLTCGKGGRKTSSKRSFGCNMDSKYPNTQTVQIHHLLDQFQWILTPGIVYLYCISLGGRSGVHVPNPLLKKPLCYGPETGHMETWQEYGRCGGVEVQEYTPRGGLEVWRCGGVEVWRCRKGWEERAVCACPQ